MLTPFLISRAVGGLAAPAGFGHASGPAFTLAKILAGAELPTLPALAQGFVAIGHPPGSPA